MTPPPSATHESLLAHEVLAYLRANPNFVQEHPEVLEWLQIPEAQHGDGVLDFQRYAIANLQARVKQSEIHQDVMVHMSRHTHRLQAQVQQAVLRLMHAVTLEQLFECFCIDFPNIFAVDVVRLGLESELGAYYESHYPEQYYLGLTLMELGACADVLSQAQDVRMVADAGMDHPWIAEVLFHECADLARSCALIRLSLPYVGRFGLLALGVREVGRFQDGQGVEILRFLGVATSIRLDQLLSEQVGVL